ncbi:hypothetical protein GCM10022419_081090 [Nonomuraea rosea]|uniref:Uncharacterized protein n=1 Tax=Nonomuraea rosea TaxID=638574 RepID=A0ABP6YMJ2_9ACTN
MLGTVFDLAEAGPGEAAVIPALRELAWRLVVTVTGLVGGKSNEVASDLR